MTVLIIDPALHSRGGHHFSAAERLRHELAGLGLSVPCLASAQADDETRRRLDGRPVFARSLYGRQDDDDAGFAADAASTGRELANALRALPPPELVILPCADLVLVAALARTIRRSRWNHRPRVLLWLLYGPHPLQPPEDPRLAARRVAARQAYAALHAVAEVHAWCETEAMAAFWRALVPFDVGVRAGPGLAARFPAGRAGSAPPLVSCLGFANRAKGYRLLPEALAPILAEDPEVHFLVHGIVAGSDAEAEAPVFVSLAALGERVTVRHDVLEADTYLALLAATDLLLLPYDPSVYRVRGSGVFTDARRLGVPIVAPRACSFADTAFAQGWGIAMDSHDPRALSDAIRTGLARRDELARRAAGAARQQSDDLARLLREALAGLPLPAPPRRGLVHELWRKAARGFRPSPLGEPSR